MLIYVDFANGWDYNYRIKMKDHSYKKKGAL